MKITTQILLISLLLALGCKNPGDPETAPLDAGLIMYYPLNGNADDESINGFHGAIFGATPAEDRFGNANGAMEFDGVDDYIEPQTNDIELIGSFTISLWAKGLACQSCDDDEAGLVAVGALNPYGLGIDESGRILFQVVASQRAFPVEETNTQIDPNQWYHYVGVYTAGQSLILYINGQEVGRNSANIPLALEESGGRLWIGGRATGVFAIKPNFYFDGLIDDVRIYNRALTVSEISQLHSASD
ncbi:LamG domain-containing protein [bacterium]|nr:LamG domain-containing protein [bacterium]